MGLVWGTTQFPEGVVWVHTQLRPMWLWLKTPQKLYYPLKALAQFHVFYKAMVGPFMQGIQKPSEKVANLALAPNAVWQSLVPVMQLSICNPRTGSVNAMIPPVQPSQYDSSGLLQGVNVGQKLQKGRSRDMQLTMQVIGSFQVHEVSPRLGSQSLQDILPTQLFAYVGQMVAWKVSPFFEEKDRLLSENCCTVNTSNRLSSRSFLAIVIQ